MQEKKSTARTIKCSDTILVIKVGPPIICDDDVSLLYIILERGNEFRQ